MAVRKWVLLGVLAALLSGCALQPIPETPRRIALLAPFEGRYREIGYDALYAARLALQDHGNGQIELLPVDDGGTVESATLRAAAFTQDPAIQAVILAGQAATAPETQAALAGLPALALAYMPVMPTSDAVFVLENAEASDYITLPADIDIIDATHLAEPFTAGPLLALSQVPKLREDLSPIRIVTSASPPSANFIQRYRESDAFAPPPGLLSPLAYDAMGLLLNVLEQAQTTRAITSALAGIRYEGLNGTIAFAGQYWAGGPLQFYAYNADGTLSALPSP